jgi:hypothetical protein
MSSLVDLSAMLVVCGQQVDSVRCDPARLEQPVDPVVLLDQVEVSLGVT